MSSYPFFIPEFVLCANSSLFSFKIANEPSEFRNYLLQYTKDYMLGYSWEWTYSKMYDGKYTISNLHPVCTKCGMRLKQGGLYGTEMECLRCNTTQNWEDSVAYDAQLLIEDNIRKNYSQNQ